jgi:hypothetical protein
LNGDVLPAPFADRPVDLAVVDREGNVFQRLHAAEALADVAGGEQREVAH